MKRRLLTALAVLFLLQTALFAQEKEDKKDERKTHTVKTSFFEVVEEVTATVESKSMTEVIVETTNWTDLEINKIVEEGTAINQGDEIVWFKTEDIDKKLKESEFALKLAELSLQASSLDFDLTQNTFDLDTQLREKEQQHTEEDFKYFEEVDRPNREKSTRRSVTNSEHSMEYAQEELNQLSRMYSEDELTEESEEIVLKRAQRDVENRQFFLEQAQIRASRSLNVEIPREAEQKKMALDRSKLEYEKSKISMPLERDKKNVALQKSRLALENQKADFDELQKDRALMTLKSPASGVLYFGRCVRGKWMGPAGPNRDLRSGKKATPNKTLVTIVDLKQLMLRADLTEKQLASIRTGAAGVVTPTAFPDSKTTANVTKVSYVPVQADKFDCQMDLGTIPTGLMPGMTCKVRFVVVQKEAAVAVPSDAVFTNDGTNHFVYVVEGEGQRQQAVSVGMKSGSNVEITSGLAAGAKILTERPE